MGRRLKSGSIEEISFPLFVFAREDKKLERWKTYLFG